MIVAGAGSQALAAELATVTDHELADVTYDEFPDGEQIVGVDPADGSPETAVVIAATTSAAAHIEVLQLQDAAREAGADRVCTVLPYMGYARQDDPMAPSADCESDTTAFPLSARAVARALSPGTDRIITVTPHEERVCEFFTVPAIAVDAASRLAEPLSGNLSEPLFLAPDEGAVDLAESVRDAYGRGETDYFRKTRQSGSHVDIEPSDATVEGRDVVVTDDIVATGTTTGTAVTVLRNRSAARVAVACVHPLLVGNARLTLARAGVDRIIGTDTVERSVSAVSVAPSIADAL